MKNILKALREYNKRHPEYAGFARLQFYDDGSGRLTFRTFNSDEIIEDFSMSENLEPVFEYLENN